MPPNFSVHSSVPLDFPPWILFLWPAGAWILTAIIHIALALAVFSDAEQMYRRHGRKPFLVEGAIWALAVLLGGVVTAGIYWVIHHSTLCPPPEPKPVASPRPLQPYSARPRQPTVPRPTQPGGNQPS